MKSATLFVAPPGLFPLSVDARNSNYYSKIYTPEYSGGAKCGIRGNLLSLTSNMDQIGPTKDDIAWEK